MGNILTPSAFEKAIDEIQKNRTKIKLNIAKLLTVLTNDVADGKFATLAAFNPVKTQQGNDHDRLNRVEQDVAQLARRGTYRGRYDSLDAANLAIALENRNHGDLIHIGPIGTPHIEYIWTTNPNGADYWDQGGTVQQAVDVSKQALLTALGITQAQLDNVKEDHGEYMKTADADAKFLTQDLADARYVRPADITISDVKLNALIADSF